MKSTMLKKRSFICMMMVLMIMMCSVNMSVSAAKVSGGWSVSKARSSFLTASQKKMYKKAVKNLEGVEYKPVALLAKQTVAGTNYVYLCQGTTLTAKPVRKWYIITVNKNLKKKIAIKSIKKIKISDIETNENPRTGKADGGLKIVKAKNNSKALSKSVQKAFNKAKKNYRGNTLRPIALLGTQVVAGKNYRILCYASNKTSKDLFVVDVYKNLKGKCRFTSVKSLNLENYID